MEPFVRSDINAHIDAFIEDGACDIVAGLAEPVPAETICRLVGIDDALVPAVESIGVIAPAPRPGFDGRSVSSTISNCNKIKGLQCHQLLNSST